MPMKLNNQGKHYVFWLPGPFELVLVDLCCPPSDEAAQCSARPWGPASPWSHYQPPETLTMYKHLQGTHTHTHRCAPANGFYTFFLALTDMSAVPQKGFVNTCTPLERIQVTLLTLTLTYSLNSLTWSNESKRELCASARQSNGLSLQLPYVSLKTGTDKHGQTPPHRCSPWRSRNALK